MDSWLDLVPVNKVNTVFTQVENRLNIKAQNDGEMTLTVPFVLIEAEKV